MNRQPDHECVRRFGEQVCIYCDRPLPLSHPTEFSPRQRRGMTAEEHALAQKLAELSAWQVRLSTVQEMGAPFMSTLLALLLEQVHAGGKLTLVGTGPLSEPGRIGYDAALTSHTGARHAGAHGDSLEQCLEQLVIRWGRQ